jgi:transposase
MVGGMAMGLERSGVETRQVQMVCLDDLVAVDDRYRGIERVVSWRAVRSSAAPFYAPDGRYSICPAVLMKLFLVAAVEGVSSMRETLRLAERDIAIRRFLGYGLTERLPSHATVSYAQCVRFAESSIFEQLFTQVLGQCREAGLLDGTRLVVDATHVEANAALASLRAELAVVEDAAPGDHDDDEPPTSAGGERPRLALAEPRSGPTPRRVSSNATSHSLSDPDAKLRHKPGQRPHLVHRAQVATDPKRRVIVAVLAERATGSEAAALAGLVRRARFAGHRVAELGADRGYASADTYQTLDSLGVVAYIPPQRRMAGVEARAARARTRTPHGVSVKIDRMTHAEGAIGELKNQHALGRLRSRGTPKAQIQLLMAATAINLKRLARYAPAHTAAAAGDPRAATRLAATADNRASDADRRGLAPRLGLRRHLAAITRHLQPARLSTAAAL